MTDQLSPHPSPASGEPLWRDALGDELRRLRHERGETLGGTARRSGVTPQYLSEWSAAGRNPPAR